MHPGAQDTLEDEDKEDADNETEETVSPKTVGHNIYILIHQVVQNALIDQECTV